jgi:uncharacterized alkaline shock family protein YloU
MTQTVPDGPTDPRRAAVPEEEVTAIVPPPGHAIPPIPSGPPAPGDRAGGGRIYGTGERRSGRGPEGGAGRGRTTIADQVVERVIGRIVDLAAEEVAGMHGLHASASAGDAPPARPVSVRLDGDRAVIDLAIEVEFGHPLHEVVEAVRDLVIGQSERLLGLTVAEVNVLVAEVSFDPEG